MMIIVLLYALLASTFSLGKIILHYTQPFFLVGIRMTLAGIILLAYYSLFEKNKVIFEARLLWLYVQAILFIIYIPYTLRYWGLQHVTSSQAAFLYNFGPFISYIIACTMYKEEVSWQKIGGLVIGFAGLLVLLLSNNAIAFSSECYCISIPHIAILCSITSLSYGWVIMSQLLKDHQHPPVLINGISMLGGGLLGLTTAYFCEQTRSPITEYRPFLVLLIIIIIISNLICHNLYASLLKRYTPTMLACASFLSPCFTALYGWLFLKEPLSLHFFIAITAVLLGVLTFYLQEIRIIFKKRNSLITEKHS